MRFRWGRIGLWVDWTDWSVSVPMAGHGDNVWRMLFGLRCALCKTWLPYCETTVDGIKPDWVCQLGLCGLCSQCYDEILAADAATPDGDEESA